MDENKFNTILHSPIGTRDIYEKKCIQKLHLQEVIHNVFLSYGFSDIQTPVFEYFNVFDKEKGSVSTRQMYKFFDRDNNTLVLRPDITPAVARCIAKYYAKEELQIRKCYIGNTFVNVPPYKGKLNEITQAGAELYNDDTSDADAEMISLMKTTLEKAGLKKFQIELGHAKFLKGLFNEAALPDDAITELCNLIESKNFFGVMDILDNYPVSKEIKEIFEKLPEYQDDFDSSVEYILKRTSNEDVIQALDRLSKVKALLEIYGVSSFITIDLSCYSTYEYYTGIIFKAYTYGSAEALASGGRYDKLVSHFGKDAPAIGLAINIDELLISMIRQDIDFELEDMRTYLLYDRDCTYEALEKATELRQSGRNVMLVRKSSRRDVSEYKTSADAVGINDFIYINKDQ